MTTRSVRLPALSSVVASRIATLGVSLAVGVLTARALGPADRGRLALSLACSAVFAVACAAGLDTANLRFAGADKASHGQVARASLRFVALVGPCAAGLWAALAVAVPPARLGLDPVTFGLTLASCPLVLLVGLLGAAEIGRGRAVFQGAVTVASLLVFGAGTAAAAVAGRAGPATAVGAYAAGQVVAAAVLIRASRLRWSMPGVPPSYRSFARRAYLPTVAHFAMLRTQVPVIQVLAGAGVVGLFSVAVPLAEMLLIVPVALSVGMVPSLSGGPADWRVVGRITWRTTLLTVLTAAVLAAAAPLAVPLLYGAPFQPAVPVVWSLLPGVALFAIARTTQAYFTATDHPGPTVAAALAATAVGTAGLVLLVPGGGAVGAGLATSAGFGLYAVVIWTSFLSLHRRWRAPAHRRRSAGPAPRLRSRPVARVWTPKVRASAAVAGTTAAAMAAGVLATLGPGPLRLVLGGAVLVLALVQPVAGLCCLAAAVPASVLPGFVPLGNTELLILAMCCLAGALLRNDLAARRRRSTFLVAALVGMLTVGAILTRPGSDLLDALLPVAVVAIPIAGLPLVVRPDPAGRLVALTFAMACAGVGALGQAFPTAKAVDGDPLTVVNHNTVGAMLVVALCVLLTRWAGPASTAWRACLALAIAAVVVAIAFSYSRSSYLGAAAVLLVFLARRSVLSALGGGLAALAALPLLPASIVERVTNTTTSDGLEVSAGVRLDLWVAAVKMFADFPVFGVGYQAFGARLPRYFVPSDLYASSELQLALMAHPHNLYLAVLAETGLAGAVAVGGLLAIVVRGLRHANPPRGLPARAAATALLGVGICSVFGEPLLTSQTLIPLVMVLSASVGRVDDRGEPAGNRSTAARPPGGDDPPWRRLVLRSGDRSRGARPPRAGGAAGRGPARGAPDGGGDRAGHRPPVRMAAASAAAGGGGDRAAGGAAP